MTPAPGVIAALLKVIHEGTDPEKEKAKDDVIDLLYRDFQQRAHRGRRRERPGHSLQTTALTNEALARMLKKDKSARDEFDKAANEHHLFRAFVRAVRQALIDHAGGVPPGAGAGGELGDLLDDIRRRGRGEVLPQIEVLSLHEALASLAAESPRAAEALELRFFGGCDVSEVAAAMEMSQSTVERDLRFGLAWLRDFLSTEGTP